mgnify:CR=1 FL=1
MSRSNLPPAPTSGAWREGDPVAFRKFANLGAQRLENGEILPSVTLAYETWGELDEASSNAVLILHALTGDAHVCGEAAPGQPTPGWWEQIVGPGRIIDTDRYFVVAANVLGGCQGSTGPASIAQDGAPYGSRFPVISTRDQVRAEARLADLLGIERWNTVVGASLGGHRAIEWATMYPRRVERLVMVASGAQTTAEQAAWAHTQIRAVQLDPHWNGGDYYDDAVGPVAGLALARQIAHTTYRSPAELEHRFGREENRGESVEGGLLGQPRGRYAIESYLDHHGNKLVERFDANSYLAVNEALISHDVARGRGSLSQALARTDCEWTIAAVNTDRLFFPHESHRLAEALPTPVEVNIIESNHGHDGFLIEAKQVERILARALGTAEDEPLDEKTREREALESITNLYRTVA